MGSRDLASDYLNQKGKVKEFRFPLDKELVNSQLLLSDRHRFLLPLGQNILTDTLSMEV